MDEKTKALCEDFIINRNTVRRVFGGESILVYPVAANAITAAGARADIAKLKESKKIIRRHASLFAYQKGHVTTPFAANLSLKEDIKAHFDQVAKLYKLCKKRFSRSDDNTLLAVMLADYVPEEKWEEVLDRGKTLYEILRRDHAVLTNDQDSVLCGLLALSVKNNSELLEDLEKCYDLLNIKFSGKSSIQTVSYVLALTEDSAREKVEHMIELYDSLKEKKKKYGTGGELAALAAASILDHDIDRLCERILSIDEFLSKQKGYGFLGLGKKPRLMHAAMLTTDLYDSAQEAAATASAASVAMAAAQQLAIFIIIATALVPASDAGAD